MMVMPLVAVGSFTHGMFVPSNLTMQKSAKQNFIHGNLATRILLCNT